MKNEDPENNGQPIHQPEYVILDAEATEENEGSDAEQERRQTFEALKNLGAQRFPWSIHFIVLGSLVLISLVAFFCLLFLSLNLAFSGLLLFQNSNMNVLLNKSWRAFKRVIVMMVGFSIALFSPAFGFSVIMLYFLLHNDEVQGPFIKRFFQGRFT